MLPKSRAAGEVGKWQVIWRICPRTRFKLRAELMQECAPLFGTGNKRRGSSTQGIETGDTRPGAGWCSVHCLCVLCDGEDCVTGSSVSLESGHQEMEECGQGPMTWHSAVTSSSSDTVTHTASILYLAADILLPSTRCAILMNIKCSIHDTVLAVQFLHRG